MKQGAWLSIYKIHGDCVSIYTHIFTKTTESVHKTLINQH